MELNTSIESLMRILDSNNFRFGNYQVLPPEIESKFGQEIRSSYSTKQLSLDASRYDFINSCMDLNSKKIVEIGSNLGYFILRLSAEKNCKATGYEPIKTYVEASNLMSEIMGVKDNATFINKAIGIDDINKIDFCDVYIELNVLHHAGIFFDEYCNASTDAWIKYSIDRLSRIRDISDSLIFQTGNTRNGAALFPSVDAVDFMADILVSAGWNIKSFGTIVDLESMRYREGSLSNSRTYSVYKSRRSTKTCLVEYSKDGKLVAELLTGLANRPIWICE